MFQRPRRTIYTGIPDAPGTDLALQPEIYIYISDAVITSLLEYGSYIYK